jgi:hypothetical protein
VKILDVPGGPRWNFKGGRITVYPLRGLALTTAFQVQQTGAELYGPVELSKRQMHEFEVDLPSYQQAFRGREWAGDSL